MSEVSASSIWNDDGPSTQTNNPIVVTRSPPPLPAQKPIGLIATTPSAATAPPPLPPHDHIEDDLIQFESEEERAATVGLNGNLYGHQIEKKAVKTLEDVMNEFLKVERSLSLQDYMRRFYQVRVEQTKFLMEPEYASICAISPQYFERNRYRDILPYDHNRVEIEKDEENPDGYMNASFVQLPGGKTQFIAAQAPLPSTLDEWWKMIDEHNVTLIVILCKLIEQNKIKCERYWPNEIGKSELFGDYEIKFEEEITFEDDEYLLRKLLMQNQTTGETRIVYQLHYKEWPDHGCPSGEKQLLNMIEEMAKIHELQGAKNPILVHCSAGVGRTGTIIAVNHIREQIKAETLNSIDIFGLVMTLRRQRACMVQTQDQYQFVHRCVASYCRTRLGIEEPIKQERPQNAHDLQLSHSSSVKLIAPPTPTAGEQQDVADSYQLTSSERRKDDDEDYLDVTNVPDFPNEPPAPLGPEHLGSAAQ